MGLDYFIFYAEANIVCILIFILFLFHDRIYGTRQEKQIWFDRTLAVHILYFLSDIGWAAVLGGIIPRVRILVVLFNFLNFVLIALIAYEWFRYMVASENALPNVPRHRLRLLALPVAVSVAVMVILYVLDPKKWVSDAGELNPLYYPLMLAVPLLYIIASFVISLANAKKAESGENRRLFLLIGIYPLAVVLFGIIQLFSLNAPLFCFGCTLMMLFFYIQTLQTRISVDSLTHLNNRGQINRFMQQVRYRENVRCYAAMIDVDRFKQINDTYGHAEGDRALILVSESLKQTAERAGLPLFIGRYGGDEFVMIAQAEGETDTMESISALFRSILQEKAEANHLLYQLNVSIGWDLLRSGSDTLEACLMRADEKLYENKRSLR